MATVIGGLGLRQIFAIFCHSLRRFSIPEDRYFERESQFGPKHTREPCGQTQKFAYPYLYLGASAGRIILPNHLLLPESPMTPEHSLHRDEPTVFRLVHSFLLAASFCVLLLSGSVPGWAQDTSTEKFGDWEVSCGTPPGSREKKCALVQSVIDEERSNVGLRIVFLLGTKGERVLRVVAPLGVLLPFGLGLRIDDEPISDKPIPFIRCRPLGCIAEIVVKDALMDKLKTGKTALFIIVETKEEGRAIPVSLSGFTKGFDHLTSTEEKK